MVNSNSHAYELPIHPRVKRAKEDRPTRTTTKDEDVIKKKQSVGIMVFNVEKGCMEPL